MNERLLRNALTHFTKALEREKETHGTAELSDDREATELTKEQDYQAKLRMAHGTAKVSQMFIDEVSVQRCQMRQKLIIQHLDRSMLYCAKRHPMKRKSPICIYHVLSQ